MNRDRTRTCRICGIRTYFIDEGTTCSYCQRFIVKEEQAEIEISNNPPVDLDGYVTVTNNTRTNFRLGRAVSIRPGQSIRVPVANRGILRAAVATGKLSIDKPILIEPVDNLQSTVDLARFRMLIEDDEAPEALNLNVEADVIEDDGT